MIYTELYGRLGNQMFRYAMARYLQLTHYPSDEICLSYNQIDEAGKIDPTFYHSLEDFNISHTITYQKSGKVIFNESSIIQKLLVIPYYLGLRKFSPEQMIELVEYETKWTNLLEKNGVYWYRRNLPKSIPSGAKNKFVSGNFESPIFIDTIRKELLSEFTPKFDLLEKNRDLFEIISTKESVCVSIRRGDFESNPEVSGLHSVCDRIYFEKAVSKMKVLLKNPVFILFSDDIEWAKENIITESETYFEDGADPVWEKVRLMSSCKHFIISNSSFSWWTQWLSTNETKIVISPSKWFNNDFDCPLIDKNWVLIDKEM
ncbi:alpha-1,2-fucosyltransferase [Streptococcus saliviloxodontae]|uniref:Alpha-1,2-fucosyltransferase n=1 Tax=Streptococcus saliviloxodontae TaxID=1349416 RepID=A0ABS2PKU7_9STRE|nr:alpha-1,2-fucosyltransferase [Streptococcus saliviloxodontae]MBM7635984.1 hypothetical protein [Streptococcus saliviloxodontae]